MKSRGTDKNVSIRLSGKYIKYRIFLLLLVLIALRVKHREDNAVSDFGNEDFVGERSDVPGDNAFQELRNDAPERNRSYSRSMKTRRSARSQNVSDLSERFILRCIGPSSYSCQGRCSRGWDKGPTVERPQYFCDAYCENFNDCCADFDLYCY